MHFTVLFVFLAVGWVWAAALDYSSRGNVTRLTVSSLHFHVSGGIRFMCRKIVCENTRTDETRRCLHTLLDSFSALVEAVSETGKRQEECRAVEDDTDALLSEGEAAHMEVCLLLRQFY